MNDHDVKLLVCNVLQGKDDSYRIISHTDYVRSTGKHKSDVYSHFHFLCTAEFYLNLGWVVCNFSLNGL